MHHTAKLTLSLIYLKLFECGMNHDDYPLCESFTQTQFYDIAEKSGCTLRFKKEPTSNYPRLYSSLTRFTVSGSPVFLKELGQPSKTNVTEMLTLVKSSLSLIQDFPSTDDNLMTIFRALFFSPVEATLKSFVRKVPTPNETAHRSQSLFRTQVFYLPFLKPRPLHCSLISRHLLTSKESE